MRRAEPERELIRRVTPFLFPAVGVAFALGAALGGPNAGWSTAIGVSVVAINFLGAGLSFAWAAAISPMALAAVGVVGFFVRMATILVLMIALNRLDWFSPTAFAAAVVPATAVLLMFEMKVLSGRMQADMWSVGETSR
ncbi:MAG TPA: hypothetical protein VGR33_00400 [Actinomycetota bacterium]|nr:hypothetical protein [Actinomycetota bacterium]